MKEQEIDKYIGKVVKVKDFENDEYVGILYKIENHEVVDYYLNQYYMPINKGYYLECGPSKLNLCYRKSHIKKINTML